MLLIRILIVASILLMQYQAAWGQSKLKSLCQNPVARIYSENSYLPIGSFLCKGDRVQPKDGGTVEVLCLQSRKFIHLSVGLIDRCMEMESTANVENPKKCTFQTQKNCPRTRGLGDSETAPIVKSPYGTTLLQRRPAVSWYKVPNATSYVVYIEGHNLNWQATTEQTTLAYPQNQPQLEYGTAYKITVLAKKEEEVIGSSKSAVIFVLPENEAQEIIEKVKKVNSLGLSPDEAAYLDLDAVYLSKDLLNEAIETLNARVAAGSKNPTLYRVLGDRYLQAGLLPEAKGAYSKAIALARSSGNTEELLVAQEHLSTIQIQSQLPTSRNAAQ